MRKEKTNKSLRILSIFFRMMQRECINVCAEANCFDVSEKSIRRDIGDIRAFLANQMAETGRGGQVKYDYSQQGYVLVLFAER